MRSFWGGCLKNADKKKDKILQVKKKFGIEIEVIKPNERKIIEPDRKLANSDSSKLNLNLNGSIQGENKNEFNNNLINENDIDANQNVNEKGSLSGINENN